MKKKSVFNSIVWMVCCLSAVMFASCSKDDDNKQKGLKFNVAKVEVIPTGTANVTIGNGTQPFTVKSSDEKLAKVTVDKNVLTVTGVKEGKGTIMVTDKNKLMGTLPFMVVAPLSFDKAAVEVTVGQEATVTVKSGDHQGRQERKHDGDRQRQQEKDRRHFCDCQIAIEVSQAPRTSSCALAKLQFARLERRKTQSPLAWKT